MEDVELIIRRVVQPVDLVAKASMAVLEVLLDRPPVRAKVRLQLRGRPTAGAREDVLFLVLLSRGQSCCICR